MPARSPPLLEATKPPPYSECRQGEKDARGAPNNGGRCRSPYPGQASACHHVFSRLTAAESGYSARTADYPRRGTLPLHAFLSSAPSLTADGAHKHCVNPQHTARRLYERQGNINYLRTLNHVGSMLATYVLSTCLQTVFGRQD